MKSLSHVWLFATLWTVGWQAPMSSSERPLRGPSSDISRQGSGGMSAQTWSFSSFSFCPVWSPTLEVGTQFFVLNQPWTVWLQLGLRTLFSSPLQKWNLLLVFSQFINYCRAPTLYQTLMLYRRNTPMTQVNPSSVGAWRTKILQNASIKCW